MEIHGALFAINETPCCVWDTDPAARNAEFITNLQPEFFRYLADAHTPDLTGPRRQFASTALAAAYGQGLETLFATLFASLQAPHCVVGWLPKYRQEDLSKLVGAIDHRPILTNVPLTAFTWEGVVDAIHRHVGFGDAEAWAEIKKQVARLWRRLAADFLNPLHGDQYNTIKHGFRGQLGGVRLHVGEPLAGGAAPPAEKFLDLGGSDTGSCFFAVRSVGRKYQFKLKRVARNWCPETLAHRLRLIACSLSNVIGFLKILNRIGSPDGISFGWPDTEMFEQALRQNSGVVSVTFPSVDIGAQDVSDLTKEEVLATYPPSDPGTARSQATQSEPRDGGTQAEKATQ